MQLSIQTAKEMYESGIPSIVNFALENYPELAKPKHPKKWEELKRIDGYFIYSDSDIDLVTDAATIDENRDLFHTKPQAEVSLVLAQLSQLMAVYRNGWLPDWEDDNQLKHCIVIDKEGVRVVGKNTRYEPMSFQDESTAQAFATDHKDLILQLKKF